MSLQESPRAPQEDVTPLVEIANTVLRRWRLVLLLPLLLAFLAGVWSLTRERHYVVSASFMPQGEKAPGMSGAAALAQQFGVTLAPDGGGQSPQFYADLLHSRALLRQAVETQYSVPTENGTWQGTLVEYWDIESSNGLPAWHRAIEVLAEEIAPSVRRETGLIRFTVSTDHPLLSEQISATLLELLNQFNLEVRQTRAQEESRFISGRITEAQASLREAEGQLQEFLLQNRMIGDSPELRFQRDRLERQVSMRQEVYTSLLRSQEQARIDAVRDIPLLTVIDQPAGAAEPEGRGTVMKVALAFMIGLMLALFVAFLAEIARRSREAQDPRYLEFQRLTRSAWHDLRHPGRWLARQRRPRE
ncbi:MAG TPA: GNVR domain-containing protein [Longimicrobiales bacterium]